MNQRFILNWFSSYLLSCAERRKEISAFSITFSPVISILSPVQVLISGGFNSVLCFNLSCISREWAAHSPGRKKFKLPMQDDVSFTLPQVELKQKWKKLLQKEWKKVVPRRIASLLIYSHDTFSPAALMTMICTGRRFTKNSLQGGGGVMQFAASKGPSWIYSKWFGHSPVGKLRSNFPVQDDDILRFTLPD